MNILLYSLRLRAELLMRAYQKAYQEMLENARNHEITALEIPEIPEIPEYAQITIPKLDSEVWWMVMLFKIIIINLVLHQVYNDRLRKKGRREVRAES